MSMNLLQQQNALKDMSDAQVTQQLQSPSGQVPQFLLLAELSRRERMRSDASRQQAAQEPPDQTVKDEAVNAAGVPQGPLPGIARAMAPQTSVASNDGIARMARGGPVRRMAGGGGVPSAVMADPAIAAYAANLGMTVDQYWASLSAAQQATIAQQATGRGYRDQLTKQLTPSDPREPLPSQAAIAQGEAGRASQDEAARQQWLAAQRTRPSGIAVGGAGADASAIGVPGPQAMMGIDMRGRASSPGYSLADASGAQTNAATLGVDPNGAPAMPGGPYASTGLPAAPSWWDTIWGTPTSSDHSAYGGPRQLNPGAMGGATGPAGAPGTYPADDLTTPPPGGVAPPAGGNQGGVGQPGGGGAGAGTSSGGGASQPAVSSYEQELIDALKESEKRAEQDKWLSIAMAGLQTLGAPAGTNGVSAIGQGNAAGLAMYMQLRDQRQQDKLGLQSQLEQYRQQQAAKAAAAAGGGSGRPDLSALTGGLTVNQAYSALDDAATAATAQLEAIPIDPETKAPLTQFADQYKQVQAVLADIAQRKALLSPITGGLGGLSTPLTSNVVEMGAIPQS